MSDRATLRRRLRLLVPATLVLLMAVGLPSSPASAAGGSGSQAVSKTIYHGDAWGSTTKRANQAHSGHSAMVVLGCVTQAGKTFDNVVTGVHGPDDGFDVGHVLTTAQTIAAGGAQTSKLTSSIENLTMFQGLITADQVKAVSATTRQGGAYSFSTEGSEFVNLTINGQSIGQEPESRTIALPGLGKVVLFANGHSISDGVADQWVNMLVVDILHPNAMGIPVGTHMVMSHANSQLQYTAGPLSGRAWGSQITSGDTLESNPSFRVYLPCKGTDGELIQQSGAEAGNTAAPMTTGNVTNTAQGTVGQIVSLGETTSKVSKVNIGDGQITADYFKADAEIVRRNGEVTIDTSGSSIGGLSIMGQDQSGAPDPNTVIDIPGLGRLTLYEVTKGPNSVTVRMFHLEVLKQNPSFPLGTDVVLSYAQAAVH